MTPERLKGWLEAYDWLAAHRSPSVRMVATLVWQRIQALRATQE